VCVYVCVCVLAFKCIVPFWITHSDEPSILFVSQLQENLRPHGIAKPESK